MRTVGGIATHQRLMKRQERRGAYGDGDLSDASWTEEERPESAEQPVTQRQVRRPLSSTAQDDQLLLEQEILRDHRSQATGATQLCGHDGQVKQGEQEVLHARDSVGQTSGATQRCPNPGISEKIGNSRRTSGTILVPGWSEDRHLLVGRRIRADGRPCAPQKLASTPFRALGVNR